MLSLAAPAGSLYPVDRLRFSEHPAPQRATSAQNLVPAPGRAVRPRRRVLRAFSPACPCVTVETGVLGAFWGKQGAPRPLGVGPPLTPTGCPGCPGAGISSPCDAPQCAGSPVALSPAPVPSTATQCRRLFSCERWVSGNSLCIHCL